MRIRNGHLSLLAGGGIRDIDNPDGFSHVDLPTDLQWYLSHVSPRPPRRIANINLTPNFPVVAQAWSALIKRATGRQIDGAFAIDPMAIAQLLGDRALHVDAFSRPLNAGNLVQMVENQQYRLAKPVQNAFPEQLIAASWGVFTDPPSVLDLVHRLGTTSRGSTSRSGPRIPTYRATSRSSGGAAGSWTIRRATTCPRSTTSSCRTRSTTTRTRRSRTTSPSTRRAASARRARFGW